MINLIVTLSKYLLLILIALYTLESFIVFGYRYEEDKRYILKKQLMLTVIVFYCGSDFISDFL